MSALVCSSLLTEEEILANPLFPMLARYFHDSGYRAAEDFRLMFPEARPDQIVRAYAIWLEGTPHAGSNGGFAEALAYLLAEGAE